MIALKIVLATLSMFAAIIGMAIWAYYASIKWGKQLPKDNTFAPYDDDIKACWHDRHKFQHTTGTVGSKEK